MTEIPSIVDRLASAGLPADNHLNRRAALPGPVQELHRRILGPSPPPEYRPPARN